MKNLKETSIKTEVQQKIGELEIGNTYTETGKKEEIAMVVIAIIYVRDNRKKIRAYWNENVKNDIHDKI